MSPRLAEETPRVVAWDPRQATRQDGGAGEMGTCWGEMGTRI